MSLFSNRRVSSVFAIFIWPVACPLYYPSCRGSIGEEDETPREVSEQLREEEVRFSSGRETLAGTLFWPASKTDCPAVVILAGSDRSKRGPLRTRIARHFAAHNVA